MCDVRAILWGLFACLLSGNALSQTLSDPTRRPDTNTVMSSNQHAGWTLQATRISGEQRSAVLNGQSVHEGDVIAGARILRIEHGQIHLIAAGKRTAVSMFAPINKTLVTRKPSSGAPESLQGSQE